MAMPTQGQTVRVTAPRQGGGEATHTFYAVAEPDPKTAEDIVREAIGSTPDDVVEAVGLIPAEDIAALKLSPGQFERL
jgi:hypothetical protein